MSNKKDKKKGDKEEDIAKSWGAIYYEEFETGVMTLSKPDYPKPPVKKPQKKSKKETNNSDY